MEIILVANAGIAVCVEDATVLVDAPVPTPPLLPFSGITETEFNAFFLNGKFGDATAILYTHAHSDHIDLPWLCKYIKKYPTTQIYLPHSFVHIDKIMAQSQAVKTPEYYLPYPICKGITLTALPILHMGSHYCNVAHQCFILRVEEKTLLFLADADPVNCAIFESLDDCVDVLFVNPFYLHSARNCNLIENLCPEILVIYHVPFKGRGKEIRSAAQYEAAFWRKKGFYAVILEQYLQTIYL